MQGHPGLCVSLPHPPRWSLCLPEPTLRHGLSALTDGRPSPGGPSWSFAAPLAECGLRTPG